MDLEKLLEKIEAYNPTADWNDCRGLFLCAKAHAGQFRFLGTPISNILWDCFYTTELELDVTTIVWAPP